MKIGFFGMMEGEDQDFIRDNLPEHQLSFFAEFLSDDCVFTDASFEIISVFVNCQVSKKVIDALPNLKLIAARSTGFDNIDIEYAKSKNILVTNVPSYGSNTVAEFTFGLILSLSRHIPEAITRLKKTDKFNTKHLCGFDLFGKTLGVIGTGKIGANVIRIAKSFGMKVVGHDAFPDQTSGFEYISLEKLLQTSDIITLHVPYNKDTHHLINKNTISLIKRGAYLINTSRGGVVETAALYEALKSGQLAGAGLDVLEDEQDLSGEETLINLPQVIVTPHMAFDTKEAEKAILETTVKNIRGFVNEKFEDINLVNPPR